MHGRLRRNRTVEGSQALQGARFGLYCSSRPCKTLMQLRKVSDLSHLPLLTYRGILAQ